MYHVISRVSNRPNGQYRFRTDIPTFLLDVGSSSSALQVAYRMITDLVRQDLSAGAEVHIEVCDDNGNDYAFI